MKKGHASKAFLRRLFKEIFSKELLSGNTICLSYTVHTAAAAFRTNADICFPDCHDQFGYGQIPVSLPEALVPLQSKNLFQVFAFTPVIQETIVTDFLKS